MYYILSAIFYCISILPFKVLYFFSDVLYVVIYKLFKYRKNVTIDNLTKSFPEKSVQEIENIAKKYYKNLCDNIVETIKLQTISKAALNKRFTGNWQVVNNEHGKGRVLQGHLCHQFNWEWGTVVCNWNMPLQFVGLYNKVSNNAIDKYIYKLRSRSGGWLLEMNAMQKQMANYQQQDIIWGFVADQNPSEPRRSAWVNFMGRETAFFKGAELIARRYNNIIIFGRIVKLKRGYYNIELTKAFDNAKDTKDGEITQAYVKFLEEGIRLQPENWVWSHRRWKHVRKS